MNTHYYTDLNDFSSQSKRNKKTTDRVLQCLPDNWSGQIPDLYCTTICGCSRIGGTEKCQNNDNNYNDYYATQCEFNLLLNNMHNICKVFTAFKINKLKKKESYFSPLGHMTSSILCNFKNLHRKISTNNSNFKQCLPTDKSEKEIVMMMMMMLMMLK